jgi:hypothetical protein
MRTNLDGVREGESDDVVRFDTGGDEMICSGFD